MNYLSFTLDVSGLSLWDRENLALCIMRQGFVKGMTADAEIQGIQLTVNLQGEWHGWLLAYEAAIRSWVSQNTEGGKREGDGKCSEGTEGAGG